MRMDTQREMDTKKSILLGLSLEELEALVTDLGMPRFVGRQLADWLYQKKADTWEQMRNISKGNREKLQDRCVIGRMPYRQVQTSVDGTRKYLFGVDPYNPSAAGKSLFVEAVYIPDGERGTLCVSSQAGCRMGCKFCMTGRQGFQANLMASEILNQLFGIEEFDRLTNVVYMGMGEPMDNLEQVMCSLNAITSDWGLAWSPSRITVSTIGVIPAMKQFLTRSRCSLAVSLHAPDEAVRRSLMPVQNAHPIAQVVEALRGFEFTNHRRLSFEYILFKGINDSEKQAEALARLLQGLDARVNLIRFHAIPDSDLNGCTREQMERFQNVLLAKGVRTTIRASRGEDILAACGMLSTKANNGG